MRRTTGRLVAIVVGFGFAMVCACSGASARRRVSHSPKTATAQEMDSIWRMRSVQSTGKMFDPVEAW